MRICDDAGRTLVDVEPGSGPLSLGRAMLRRAQLQGVNLRGALLSCADLRDANLEGTDLRGAQLDDAELAGASFAGARLDDVNFERANMERANLRRTDLRSAKLQNVKLNFAKLQGANLAHQQFRGDFTSAEFQWADLTGARLRGNFTRAKFSKAVLDGASIIGQLGGVDFANTDLRKILGIGFEGPRDGMRLEWNSATQWPPGFDGAVRIFHLLQWHELELEGVVALASGFPLWALHKGDVPWLLVTTWSVSILLVGPLLNAWLAFRKKARLQYDMNPTPPSPAQSRRAPTD